MTGKLSFVNNKWQIVFFNEKKGKDATLFCQESDFSTGFSPNRDADTEVEFERDNSPQQKPIKIRPKGQEWQGEVRKEVIDYQAGRETKNKNARGNSAGKKDAEIGGPIDRNYSKDFHNPYNFVPAVPCENLNGELADREPTGHDCYAGDKFSGKLTVKMTVKTPLVIIDTARIQQQDDHKKFPARVDADGKPYIAPTAVKGMLRSGYEIITNSRMSVFTKHEDRLAFRREAKSPIPVRIEERDGNFFAKLLKYQEVDNQVMNHVAKLQCYEKNSSQLDKGKSKVALRYSDGSLPKHGDAVWVQYKKIKAGAEIQKIKKRTENDPPQTGWVAGWVCINGANISGKVFERVFLDVPEAPSLPVDKHLWEELIRNYQDIHKKELEQRNKNNRQPTDYLGNNPGQTAWSRHIYTKDDLILKHGTLCYAEIENNTIKSIFPVMISRQLYEKSPADLLSDSLKPAKSFEQLSPADRVFGWVNQKGNGAYRGQLRICTVKCLTDKDEAIQKLADLPLNILGQPKPQQGRFYVAETPQGEAQTQRRYNEDAGYKQGRGLRGRKVYPHHAHINDKNFWFSDSNFSENGNDWKVEFRSDGSKVYHREYLRPKNNNQQQRDSQNRSIGGWVKPETEFEFDIHFINLSEVELGALIWLLDLPENHFHRFGGGKPLGFGSVSLSLKNSEISNGGDLKDFYGSLDNRRKSSITPEECKSAFEKAVEDAKYQNILDSFKIACKGFDDGLPIHYPRTSKAPNPEGKSFEWFVDNSSKSGFKLPLPDLSNELGLPLKPKS